MRICRILTNNALVVLDEKGKEQIVCGKGIGYKKRPGDNVDDKLVETVYVKEGDQSFEQIRRTLEALPEEYLLLAQHIVEAANVSLNIQLNWRNDTKWVNTKNWQQISLPMLVARKM